MSDLMITIELPEELVARAKAVGLELESQSEQIIALLEAQIRKREAAKQLQEIAAQMLTLRDDEKPSEDEIFEEIRKYWAGQ